MDGGAVARQFRRVTRLINTSNPKPAACCSSRWRRRRVDWVIRAGPSGTRERIRIPDRAKWIRSLPADRYVRRPSRRWTLRSSGRACSRCLPGRARDTSAAATVTTRASSGSRHPPVTGATVGTTRRQSARSGDLAGDCPRRSRSQPVPAQAAPSRRRRVLRAQRRSPLAEPQRPGVSDAGGVDRGRSTGTCSCTSWPSFRIAIPLAGVTRGLRLVAFIGDQRPSSREMALRYRRLVVVCSPRLGVVRVVVEPEVVDEARSKLRPRSRSSRMRRAAN